MRNLLIATALSGVTLAVFGQLWNHDFVVMDDHLYVAGNAHVRTGLTWDNIVWAFTHEHDANWIPLTWISLMVDATLFGTWPGGYHLMSVLYHLGATLLLFAFLTRATGEAWKSAFVAAVFAVHPLHVESVAWLPERKDVLSTLFGMAALAAYVAYARQGSRRAYVAALAAFLCSLLAKQMLVTLPFLLLLLDWWPLGRFRLQNAQISNETENVINEQRTDGRPAFFARSAAGLIAEKVPFLLITVLFSAIAFFIQRHGGAVRTFEQFPFSVRVANALFVTVTYLARTFWPQDLAAYYPHAGRAISFAQAGIAAAILCAVTAVALAARRRRFLAVGWLWYLGTLVPVIGLVQIGTQGMADRYTYVPLIGIFIGIAWLVPSLLPAGKHGKVVLATAALGIVAALSLAAWRQTGYWKNSITLFQHAVAATDGNAVAHLNLGKALFEGGDSETAIKELENALAIVPDSSIVHGSLGAALHSLQRLDDAAGHLEEAVRLAPDSATARVNLANLYRDRGDLASAIREYQEAVRLAPNNSGAMINLANALAADGRPVEGVDPLERVLRTDPDNVGALTSLGIILNQQGRTDESIRHLRRALDLEPDSANTAYNLGAALYSAGEYDEAQHYFEQTLRLQPGHREAPHSLALTLLNLGSRAAEQKQLPAAIELFARAHQLAPGEWRTSYNLAAALAIRGDTAAAVDLYRQAIAANPESVQAHHQLGRLLLRQGDRAEAEKHFREALRIRPDFREAQDDLQRATGKE